MNLNTVFIFIVGIWLTYCLATIEEHLTSIDAQLDTIQIQTVDCYPHPYEIAGNPKLEGKTK